MKHYANPDETIFTGALFTFQFGAYGDTEVCVYQRPGHIDDALETAAEWLKEHQPGHFVEPEYRDACAELGHEYAEFAAGDLEPEHVDKICQLAETDLTYTESGYLASWEWHVSEEPCDGPPDATFDRFDIAEAYACYWAAYHQGRESWGYQRLSVALSILTNNASDLQFDKLSENGQAIYRRLVLADGR